MSNRENPRRPGDKFTGPTKKWHRFKNIPRGFFVWGDSPAHVREMKHARIKRMRIRITVELL